MEFSFKLLFFPELVFELTLFQLTLIKLVVFFDLVLKLVVDELV